MKILLIGGTRFFGRRLLERLLSAEDEITLISRGRNPVPLSKNLRHWKMDRSDLSPSHPWVVQEHWDIIYDQICYDAAGAELACQTFAGRCAHYVFTSSQSVYGLGANLKESDFNSSIYTYANPVDTKEDYAEAKRQAEAVFFSQDKLPVTAMRFPVVLGDDDYTQRLQFHVDHIRESKPMYFPDVEVKFSFVHSDDAANVLFFLRNRTALGPLNCASPEPIRLSSFLNILENALGRKAILTSKGENADSSPYGISGDWYMNVDRLRSLGFECRPIQEYLTKLIK